MQAGCISIIVTFVSMSKQQVQQAQRKDASAIERAADPSKASAAVPAIVHSAIVAPSGDVYVCGLGRGKNFQMPVDASAIDRDGHSMFYCCLSPFIIIGIAPLFL